MTHLLLWNTLIRKVWCGQEHLSKLLPSRCRAGRGRSRESALLSASSRPLHLSQVAVRLPSQLDSQFLKNYASPALLLLPSQGAGHGLFRSFSRWSIYTGTVFLSPSPERVVFSELGKRSCFPDPCPQKMSRRKLAMMHNWKNWIVWASSKLSQSGDICTPHARLSETLINLSRLAPM